MFLQLQKFIINSAPSSIIINASTLLTIDFNNFEMNGEIVNRTHIEIGNPKYQFYTLSTITSIEAALKVIDVSAGYVPGSPCTGGNAVKIVAPASAFPLLLIRTVHNNTLAETRDIVINPSKILYIENVIFMDATSGAQVTGVLFVMNDANKTRFVTTLSYAEVFSILLPVIVS